MNMTVKRVNEKNVSVRNTIRIILTKTTCGDCITCNSVMTYLSFEEGLDTCSVKIATILDRLTEMGYFTAEYGKVEYGNPEYGNPDSVEKIYIRTNQVNTF